MMIHRLQDRLATLPWYVFAALWVGVLLLGLYSLALQVPAPTILPETSYREPVVIDSVTKTRSYYGELTREPHMFTFTLSEPQTVTVELQAPVSDEQVDPPRYIIVKELLRGVEEIERMTVKETLSPAQYEVYSGQQYRTHGSYSTSLPAGTYFLEISSRENRGRYMLHVGTREGEYQTADGLWSAWSTIAAQKNFFGQSVIALWRSPLYYVPTLLIAMVTLVVWRRRAVVGRGVTSQ